MNPETPRWRSPSVVGAAAIVCIALLIDRLLGGAKGSASDFALFLGRFHPLVVHLPIGIFLLVAAAEGASFVPKLRERVDPVLGLVLPLLTLSSLGAFLLGHLLAREGGFAAQGLLWHRRLVLLALIGGSCCMAAWAYRETRHGRLLYRGLLGLSLLLLSLGAHFGGTLSRGDSYLAKYAPGPLKPLLGGDERAKPAPSAAASAAPALEPLLFTDVVRPILKKHCVECHGPDKAKGNLRLDSLENLRKGGKNGPVAIAGSGAKSPLIQRMLLPMGDDDRMPPDDKAGPGAEQIALIRFWIDRGAREELKVRDVLPPESTRALLERTLTNIGKPPVSEPMPEPRPKAKEPTPATTSSPAPPKAVAPEPAEAAKPPRAAAAPMAILADKCGKCHGATKQKGKLRVDSKAALLVGGKSGPAILPGRPEQSELLRRVKLGLDDDEHMPPSKEPQLDPEELRILSAWIRGTNAAPPVAVEKIAAKASADSEPADTKAAEPPREQAKIAEPELPQAAPFAGPTPDHGVIVALLQNRCGPCHGGDKPTARFFVGDAKRLIAGGSSGPAVVAGKPAASLLFQRISVPLTDSDHMPPDGEPQMTPDEIAMVRAWIEGGARAGGEGQAQASSAAPAPAGAAHAEVKARPAGCGACSVGGDRPSGLAFFGSLASVLALVGRRRRTTSR